MSEYENYPNACIEVGLTCEECTSNTAREVARVCKGLRGKALGQMFVQLYPQPACSPMYSHFALAYRDASPAEVPRIEPQLETTVRKLPLRVVSAVA
jgi:hypothetical protein